jgi:hypothetical protein
MLVRVTTANGCVSGAAPIDFTVEAEDALAECRRHLKRKTLGSVKYLRRPARWHCDSVGNERR